MSASLVGSEMCIRDRGRFRGRPGRRRSRQGQSCRRTRTSRSSRRTLVHSPWAMMMWMHQPWDGHLRGR
eukprot:11185418-Alexandrium_andersonii.AAC.1